jgi:hypothetical protein
MMAEHNIRSITELSRALSKNGMKISSQHLSRIAKGPVQTLNTRLLAHLVRGTGCSASAAFLRATAAPALADLLPKFTSKISKALQRKVTGLLTCELNQPYNPPLHAK